MSVRWHWAVKHHAAAIRVAERIQTRPIDSRGLTGEGSHGATRRENRVAENLRSNLQWSDEGHVRLSRAQIRVLMDALQAPCMRTIGPDADAEAELLAILDAAHEHENLPPAEKKRRSEEVLQTILRGEP